MFSWNISFMSMNTIPISAKIIKSCAMKRSIPLEATRKIRKLRLHDQYYPM